MRSGGTEVAPRGRGGEASVGSADVADETRTEALGPNAWLVDEMYEQYRENPSSVSESWQEFFADYRSDAEAGAANGARSATAAPSTAPPKAKAKPEPSGNG